jgi:hypothetical protein
MGRADLPGRRAEVVAERKKAMDCPFCMIFVCDGGLAFHHSMQYV